MTKRRIAIQLAALISLGALTVLAGTGCACSSFFGQSGGESKAAIEMMKHIPSGQNTFMFMDPEAMRSDDDLNILYSDFESDPGLFGAPDCLGIDTADVDHVALTLSADLCDWGVLLGGDFALEEVSSSLGENGYSGSEYEGIDVWIEDNPEWGTPTWVVWIDGLFILGSEDYVKSCIAANKEGRDSLYDDEDFRDMMDRLPGGICMICGKDAYIGDADEYDGLKASGISLIKKDKNTIKSVGIFKFEDKDAAAEAVDCVRDSTENYDETYRNISVTQNGQLVEVTYEQDLEDMLDDSYDDDEDTGDDDSTGGEESWTSDQMTLQTAVLAYYIDNGHYPTNSGQGLDSPLTDDYPESWGGDYVGDACIVFSGEVMGQSNHGLVDESYLSDTPDSSDYWGSGAAYNPGGSYGSYVWYVDANASVHSWYDTDYDEIVDADEMDYAGVYP